MKWYQIKLSTFLLWTIIVALASAFVHSQIQVRMLESALLQSNTFQVKVDGYAEAIAKSKQATTIDSPQ